MNRLASITLPAAGGALPAAQLGTQSAFAMFGVVGLAGFFVLATLGIATKNRHRQLEELSP